MHLQRVIFLRIAGLMAVMTIALGTAYSYFTINRNREMTTKLWQTRSKVLEEAAQRMVLWDDRVAIRQLLLSEVRGSEVLIYAFIIKNGKPYVFTFDKGVPVQLLEHVTDRSGQKIWEYQDLEGAVFYDISTEIDSAGTLLRIGLKRSAIDAKMNPLIFSIVLICVVILGISIYLALVVARRTTREVDTLVAALKTYGDLNDDNFALTATTAEVSELVSSFKTQVAKRKEAEAALSLLNSRLEHHVHERTAQLQATNKELDAFAYTVSHDLRAPLRGIEGFSHALMEDYAPVLDGAGQDYINRIRMGCIRMGKLIDEMLKLSRITRGEIQSVPVDLGQMAEQIVDELQRSDQGRSVDFGVDTVMPAVADPALIRSVMENLLGNAWKFTGKTGEAIIRCGMVNSGPDSVYYVKDNGAGFNMEYSKKLFCAFQRLHRIDEFEGIGIGLASVQRIIIRHGGRVWAEGKEDEGATFYFTLGGES